MNGIINIYKEPGYTSHDVVAKLRRILGQKKIGHTGTLDPAAEGVLPVCLGTATRVCEFLTGQTKTYRAVLHLGLVTDTQDSDGTVLEQNEVTVSREKILECLDSFQGVIRQIPPMYSARKVNGKRLYELARKGIEVEREAREINVYSIKAEEWDLPRVTISVTCSKGTYIRTLCHDIGQTLGCGGCMDHLLRTRVGAFTLENAVKLSDVEQAQKAGTVEQLITGTDSVFSGLPSFRAEGEAWKRVQNGNPFLCPDSLKPDDRSEMKSGCRVYGPDGTFAAVYAFKEEKGMLFPRKMFL